MAAEENLYQPADLESRWQKHWEQQGTFAMGDADSRPKYYVLEMFPYPSGRLHMGHVRNYSIGDVLARFKRARGCAVLHPMGWDAFGLPAENAAIQRGVHPAVWTRSNIEAMRDQLKRLGLSYDWSREVATCDPDYYRWEQDIFLDMLDRGLAYKKGGLLNWCDSCQTTLANEQVENGLCWRCSTTVVQREMEQWYLRITDYAQELLEGLSSLPGWPAAVTSQQETWIGRSVGASIQFELVDAGSIPGVDGPLEVFTTRPDTLYGCTFMSLAPEHPWTRKLAEGTDQQDAVFAFVDRMGTTEKADRVDEKTEKEGVFLGRHAVNPVTGRPIPIYTANFVLADYGTGAVMAVPAHDQRDFEFADKYEIDKVVVIQPDGDALEPAVMTEAWTGQGVLVGSGDHDGLDNEAGKQAIVDELVAKGCGAASVNYRIRDWGISRQRYWGSPIPVIYCDGCGMVPVPRDQLPVVLPEDVEPDGEGGSPLIRHEAFWKVSCPTCGGEARRETDTFDTFMESSWYFLRYCSPHFLGGMVDPQMARSYMPVDQYIGGIEHAVMHLLYARFYTKVLRDLGHLEVDEPFANLLCQGMVCHETYRDEQGWLYPTEIRFETNTEVGPDGKERAVRKAFHKESGHEVTIGRVEKMGKSKHNTVDPEMLMQRYGADTARLFCLFASPPTKDLDWSDSGVEGCYRFLTRVWRLVTGRAAELAGAGSPEGRELSEDAVGLRRRTHQTIARVTDDIERRMQLNTAIAATMELLNNIVAFERDSNGKPRPLEDDDRAVLLEAVQMLLRLLSPFAPHITDELWQALGHDGLLEDEAWPESSADVASSATMSLVIQVKGKKRGVLEVAVDASEEEIKAAALAMPNVQKFVGDAPPRFVKYIPGRLVTIVPGG
ncbi:MAG: leucine--tRNA ligase [Deltaproteobacteria bacterium]|nr:leucine--tRNA ligase [Deltaproteobacteria bacterium]